MRFATPDRYLRLLLMAALAMLLNQTTASGAAPPRLPELAITTEPPAGWEITARRPKQQLLAVVEDELRQAPVYETKGDFLFASSATVQPPFVVEALVRFNIDSSTRASAVLECGAYALRLTRSKDEFGYSVQPSAGAASAWAASAWVQANGPRRIGSAPSWGRTLASNPRFGAAAIMPTMEENFRIELENAISSLQPVHASWRRLRIEVGADQVRMYHNGFLVIEDDNRFEASGQVRLRVRDGVRVAALRVLPPPPETDAFQPVPLDFLCNATGMVDTATLGQPGELTELNGVPMQLPLPIAGNDHVDVGASLYRYRTQTGYRPATDPAAIMVAPGSLDPARLTLQVPYRAWRRAWILAIADEDPNSVPLVNLRFYKPKTGWALDAATEVPGLQGRSNVKGAKSIKVRTAAGDAARLWLIPVELDSAALASEYREQDILAMEFTKTIYPQVAYPDPCNYTYLQGGLPSGVRIYGLTLEAAPLHAYATGTMNGNLYPHPQRPEWIVSMQSQSPRPESVRLTVVVTAPSGRQETLRQEVSIQAGTAAKAHFYPARHEYGLHTVRTTVAVGDWSQTRAGTYLALAPDTRIASPATSRWGLWCWGGAHGTNSDPKDNARLMAALGAKIGFPREMKDYANKRQHGPTGAAAFRKQWQLAPEHDRIVPRTVPKWATQMPVDPAEYQNYVETIGAKAAELRSDHPDLQYVNSLAENSVSLRLTHGVPSYAFGQPWFEYTSSEKERIHSYWTASLAAYEGVKQRVPNMKFIFGHCAPNFFLPFFREPSWQNEYFDGFGLDMPQFERMPERQPRATEPSLLYFLHQEMQQRGIQKELIHLESYFPSSHPLALGFDQQADSVVRTAVLSLALGTTKFESCWTLHDAADYWGSQHYGCAGLIGRRPEYNPKPAAAVYATMTQMLDTVDYDGWIPTGSRSTFLIRFRDTQRRRLVYATWTVRGQRPLTLALEPDAALEVYDQNGNRIPTTVDAATATVTLSPTPIWLVMPAGAITTAAAGPSVYSEAPQGVVKTLADFESPADWRRRDGDYPRFAQNHWDVVREPTAMPYELVNSDLRTSKVLRVNMTNQNADTKPMVGFYSVFEPQKPLEIPGKARALGIYGNGASAWNRLVYEVVDAKGEVWLGCGSKDAWNCDDTHSWNYFNFDGWRYMEFPLPGSAPGDNFREKDTVWWGSDAEGVVDLPLKLTKIIVVMRTHMVYVNEMLPVENLSIELDDLVAVYDDARLATAEPVQTQLAAVGILQPGGANKSVLPNPHAQLQNSGQNAAPEIARIYPPELMNDGTKLYVEVTPVEGATAYKVYVAAYPDGTGAKPLGKPEKGTPNVIYVRGLQPSIPMYLFATYTSGDGKQAVESKPSAIRKTVLRDEFPMK